MPQGRSALSEQDARRVAAEQIAELLPNDEGDAERVAKLALLIKRWENGHARIVDATDNDDDNGGDA